MLEQVKLSLTVEQRIRMSSTNMILQLIRGKQSVMRHFQRKEKRLSPLLSIM